MGPQAMWVFAAHCCHYMAETEAPVPVLVTLRELAVAARKEELEERGEEDGENGEEDENESEIEEEKKEEEEEEEEDGRAIPC